jgi:hypothetical protein
MQMLLQPFGFDVRCRRTTVKGLDFVHRQFLICQMSLIETSDGTL